MLCNALSMVLIFASLMSLSERVQKTCHYAIAVLLSGTLLASYIFQMFSTGEPMAFLRCALMAIAAIGPSCQELDRVRFREYQRQCATLTAIYCGSISSASCSDPGDKLRIMEEVGSLTTQVDATIEVLMQAGMSNPTLRKAAFHQFDLKWVGYVPKGVMFLFFFILVFAIFGI